MNIEYYRKSVYGQELMYVIEGVAKAALIGLTGRKTIDHGDMKNLEDLGCTFTEVLAPRA